MTKDEQIKLSEAELARITAALQEAIMNKEAAENQERLARHDNQRLRDALEEVREVWAGSDSMVPETCPEAYLERLLKQCYGIAVKALKTTEVDDEGV